VSRSSMCAMCTLHDLIILILFVEIMELLNMQLSQTFFYFNILLSILLKNALNLYSSHNVRDQVSHPYKTGKTRVSYIYIFTFSDTSREDNRFLAAWYQFPEFGVRFISSWIQFSFVTVVPIYLNFATFSKDILATVI
jgi:hypothetical protein